MATAIGAPLDRVLSRRPYLIHSRLEIRPSTSPPNVSLAPRTIHNIHSQKSRREAKAIAVGGPLDGRESVGEAAPRRHAGEGVRLRGAFGGNASFTFRT